MTEQTKPIKPVDPPEEVTKLEGTFFDTFTFTEPPVKTEAELKIEADAEIARLAKEEIDKNKTPEEIKDEEDAAAAKLEENKTKPPAQTPEEIQEELKKTVDILKEKKEEDLEDDEKEFLKDFEEGNLKDYVPLVEKLKDDKDTGFDTLTKNLIKEGILVDAEDIEDSQESFSKSISQTIDSKVDEWVNEIPEDYRNVLDHLRAGGDINTYLQQRQEIDYDNLDYKNPQVQEALTKALLEQEGNTPEDIVEKITDLKDLEKIEKESKRAGKIFKEQQTKRVVDFNKSIEVANKALDDKEQKEVDDLSKAIDETENIVGFKLTKKRKESFKKFLFDVDGNGETAASRSSQSAEDRIKLYWMSFIKYDFTDLEKSVTTKKTRDLSKILSRYTDTQIKSAGKTVTEVPPVNPNETPLKFPSIFDAPTVED